MNGSNDHMASLGGHEAHKPAEARYYAYLSSALCAWCAHFIKYVGANEDWCISPCFKVSLVTSK